MKENAVHTLLILYVDRNRRVILSNLWSLMLAVGLLLIFLHVDETWMTGVLC
jgi:hypothetical protein